MGDLSITVYAGSRPVLTRGIRSVSVVERGTIPSDPVREQRATAPSTEAPPPERGSGLGPAAREALVRSNAEAPAGDNLSPEERELVDRLAERDREVRRHEEAHARVGGQYAGQPSYTFQTGPDGKRYAIGGEVPIDVAPIPGDPEATITKMDVVKRAALAPAEPSTADRRIAALADAQRLEAMADLNAQRGEARAEALPTGDLAREAGRLALGAEAEPGRQFSLAA